MQKSKFDYLKDSLKVPYRVLKIGADEMFLFFEVGGEVFYIQNTFKN